MIKTYPENTIEKKLRTLKVILCVGVVIVLGLIFLSYGLGDKRFFAAGVGALAMTVGLIIWRGNLADTFSRSPGGVLEVVDDVVVAYHPQPFVYSKEELGETQIIPFPAGIISETRTLWLAVYGNVLSCTICCSANPGRCQVIYDAFLHPNSRIKAISTPELAVMASVDAFLHENRTNLVMLYQADEIPADQRDEYVAETIKRKAEEYLTYELYIYGLMIGRVVVTCRLLPLIIE